MSWEALKKKDVVDVVAPGRGATKEELAQIKEYIESLGLVPRIPRGIMGEDIVCSNSDEKRLELLKEALQNKKSKAIWCVRGGYGSARLMPELLAMEEPENQKLLIGYSDITALHILLNQKWGWPSLHAPMLWEIIGERVSEGSLNYLNAVIFGTSEEATFSRIEALNKQAAAKGEINSSIIGGNLTLVQNSLGTNWQLASAGKILLLEEVDEESYRVDRALTQLKQAGLIEEAAAIIFGDFLFTNEAEQEEIKEVLKRFAVSVKIPVLHCSEIGHGKVNDPVPLGTEAKITLGENPLISVKVR